jgi:hypothetical protein
MRCFLRVCMRVCVSYNQRRAGSKKHARPSKPTTSKVEPSKPPTLASSNIQQETLFNCNEQQKAEPSKPPTSLKQSNTHSANSNTPDSPAQVSGEAANTLKQVNQRQEPTATKATEPGKTNACANPESAAHPVCRHQEQLPACRSEQWCHTTPMPQTAPANQARPPQQTEQRPSPTPNNADA